MKNLNFIFKNEIYKINIMTFIKIYLNFFYFILHIF